MGCLITTLLQIYCWVCTERILKITQYLVKLQVSSSLWDTVYMFKILSMVQFIRCGLVTSIRQHQIHHQTLLEHTFFWYCVTLGFSLKISTNMWAIAQRDGRPVEYRWRPLFNAAKFGWCPLLECRAVTEQMRNLLKFCRGAPNYWIDLSC